MNLPYHPSLDREGWGMGKKSHIKIVRAKSRVRDNKDYITITRLGNLLPTYYLRMLLKHCISITKPHLAYKGKDCLRLFNFTTRDKNRMQIPEGVDKWKSIVDLLKEFKLKLDCIYKLRDKLPQLENHIKNAVF